MGGIADRSHWCAAIQGNLDRLEKWPAKNIIKFNREKRNVLPLRRSKPRQQCWLESSLSEKDLGLLVHTKLNMSQQCALAAHKTNNTLG